MPKQQEEETARECGGTARTTRRAMSATSAVTATSAAPWTSARATNDTLGSGLVGDVNGDCTVDVSDLLVLLSAFGNSAGGDIDGDGTTSVADLLLLLAGFGGTC